GKRPPKHLKMVLAGAEWEGKSSAGNTILGKKAFHVNTNGRRTAYNEISHSVVEGRQLTVVDSPGWFYIHTLQDTNEMDKLEIENSVYLCPPGPHAVLLVISLATALNISSLTAVHAHMSLFREDVWKHTLVLFTRGDWLGVKTVEERIESEEGLQWIVNKCGNWYHVLNNMDHSDATQNYQDQRETSTCVKHEGDVDGVKVSVVETPGWFIDPTPPDWIKDEVLHSVSMCSPGPHVLLLVVPISRAFTEKDLKALVEILRPLTERVWRHCMVLFTWGDWLNDLPVENYIAREGKELQELLERCGNRYHVLNPYISDDPVQVKELFQKIIDMVTQNKECFTTEGTKLSFLEKFSFFFGNKKQMEEEWKKREEELIRRMLKALAKEPEEPTVFCEDGT
ncbi:hypothetical protein XENOCAPTIV_028099, partial [Xenoophorus captivus]